MRMKTARILVTFLFFPFYCLKHEPNSRSAVDNPNNKMMAKR